MRRNVLCALLASSALCCTAAAQLVDKATCGVQPPLNLVVFIGKRITLHEVNNPGTLIPSDQPGEPPRWTTPMDSKYVARYKVLDVLCGDLKSREVEFIAFQHLKGPPEFSRYRTVLLYVSRQEGQFVHQKYQFQPIYETADGGWAGCGDPYAGEGTMYRGEAQAVPVRFRTPPTFNLDALSESEVRERYPLAYFLKKGQKVECIAGASAEELFTIKRQGVLKARGLYK